MAKKNRMLVNGRTPVTKDSGGAVVSNRLVGSRPAGVRQRPGLGVMAFLLLLTLQPACLRPATGVPMGGHVLAGHYEYGPLTPPEHPDAKERRAKARVAAKTHRADPTEAPLSTTPTGETRVAQGEEGGSTAGNERVGCVHVAWHAGLAK
ncbi:hypothetical protein [Archangium sp.]|uniref:hypothetical protein n=1 Tax=Archangium sp. TaxID=1872627 RepID=UPI002D6006F3|nr:hypothetical protein [Archangium sp.]HYO54483.1 hypothetical protein [Archangium sp.]